MDANSYSRIACEVFAPLYPYYAGVIVNRTGIRSGTCLDVGCGGGHLGMAVAECSALRVSFLDQSAEMLALTARNLRGHERCHQARLIQAPVEAVPVSDNSFDLVVSRGSIPFWSDLRAAFSEIQRVLKPGGHAYLGGGLGPDSMRASIQRKMHERASLAGEGPQSRIPQRTVEEYTDALLAARIVNGHVERGSEGTWVQFRKFVDCAEAISSPGRQNESF